MVKKEIFAALLTGLVISGGAVFAQGESLGTADTASDFSYYAAGNDVVISYDGELAAGYEDNTNIIIGIYDNGVLVNTTIIDAAANTELYSTEEITVRLAEEPENASVKMFVWTTDGKLIPKTAARTAQQVGTVSFKADSLVNDDPEIGT
ncbi:MAG: hypothetical protein ACI4EA_00025, partial [Candidatus Ornithomonoglobus sp.]